MGPGTMDVTCGDISIVDQGVDGVKIDKFESID